MNRAEMSGFIEEKVKEVVKANNEELLGSISNMLSKISDKPSSAISILNVPKFKRKSNEEQFKLNAKVIDKLAVAQAAVETQDLSSAKDSIIQAWELLKRRQKLVLLADTSDLGWKTVNEYETNPIASDSDDERRIFKAEARASRKAKADKTKKARKSSRPYRRLETSGSSSQTQQGTRQRPGSGLRQTLKSKFHDAGVNINDEKRVIDRMAVHILDSRADSTVDKYTYQVKAFRDFCTQKGFLCNPAHSIHVAMYLSNLIDIGKSDSVITAAFYGIKWYHNINDFADPTEDVIVKSMLECAKRTNSRPRTKKDIISSDHLKELCNMFSDSSDVIVLRDLTMIFLSYAGFLRFDEVSNLRRNDISIKSEYLSLSIKKSKTDIYRGDKEVLISRGQTSACPVTMLQR
ncbi:integrase/recombinase xerD homolog [Ruditapes philippinarum]|uniref:integrase/recombinase xerD homolog n=2 Tax=Ruditapes philippinarum TaxID=129788 RepID=UPI00295BE73F|nr:integrase/recombinase xerD homolog [Ruditapes philippinarum]